jgi:hypothetical protein
MVSPKRRSRTKDDDENEDVENLESALSRNAPFTPTRMAQSR